MNQLLSRLQVSRDKAKMEGLWRERRVLDKGLCDFASNDYLGLARDLRLAAALNDGARRYGVGSGASPLVSGYHQAHQQLEQTLCHASGHEAALLFCSGFAANLALCHALFTPEDTLIADKLIHASMIDGVLGSGARLRRYPHCDVSAAEKLLAQYPGTALLTESIFSMDGDLAPLTELSALCEARQSLLIVDDAHGFGVIGEAAMGASRLSGVRPALQIITFGKAMGCQGAAILGSRELIETLVARARHYIYSTALSPALAHVATEAIAIIASGNMHTKLHSNIDLFKRLSDDAGLALLPSSSPIQLLPVGSNALCLELGQRLREAGFLVGAIRPPTVPGPRLRITLSASHTEDQIGALVKWLAVNSAAHGVDVS
ncbi:aminotransferase class I/II-fold pyridoxal phosphate-dependent enzyme [Shewanella sp.]|uniref:aminotransferase class I/II-fold pyridoxal phosphate-dependent enzyme n=1 Tax=Shewanella sp. TaxID=50422 RepID=UPI00356AEC0C